MGLPRGDSHFTVKKGDIWVCLKMLCTPKPNGFADHYAYEKWLFHWEHTLFSDKPISIYHSILVGGIPTPVKNISQWEGLSHI